MRSEVKESQRAELLTRELESAMAKLRGIVRMQAPTVYTLDVPEAATLLQHIAALTQRVEAAPADAERYAYLKDCTAGEWEDFNDIRLAGASLDAAIDARSGRNVSGVAHVQSSS